MSQWHPAFNAITEETGPREPGHTSTKWPALYPDAAAILQALGRLWTKDWLPLEDGA